MQPNLNFCSKHDLERNIVCEVCKKIKCEKCFKMEKDGHCKFEIHPEFLKKYEFISYIGRRFCDCSKVFKVKDFYNNFYALKIIDYRYKPKNEVEHFSKIKHPNIIQYFSSEILESEKLLGITIELAEFSLADLMDNLSIELANKYFFEMCLGVQNLHSNNILHGNLKPSNILITQNLAKISDFRYLHRDVCEDHTQEFCLLFDSPEILWENELSKKGDIWSLGIMFHMMLSKGKFPFEKAKNTKKMLDTKRPMTIDPFLENSKYETIIKGFLEYLLLFNYFFYYYKRLLKRRSISKI